jgi:hypothetical protein
MECRKNMIEHQSNQGIDSAKIGGFGTWFGSPAAQSLNAFDEVVLIGECGVVSISTMIRIPECNGFKLLAERSLETCEVKSELRPD